MPYKCRLNARFPIWDSIRLRCVSIVLLPDRFASRRYSPCSHRHLVIDSLHLYISWLAGNAMLRHWLQNGTILVGVIVQYCFNHQSRFIFQPQSRACSILSPVSIYDFVFVHMNRSKRHLCDLLLHSLWFVAAQARAAKLYNPRTVMEPLVDTQFLLELLKAYHV